MYHSRTISIYLFAFISFVNFGFSYEMEKTCLETIKGTYIFPNQMLIKENGVFIVTDQGIGRITKLIWNDEGFFTGNVQYKKCPNGHPLICLDCHGCGNKKCLWRCNCYGGPRQD